MLLILCSLVSINIPKYLMLFIISLTSSCPEETWLLEVQKKYWDHHRIELFRLLELLAKRDFVLSEIKKRVIRHTTKQHYLNNTIPNEIINVIAREVEKNLLKQLKKGHLFFNLYSRCISLGTIGIYLAFCSL